MSKNITIQEGGITKQLTTDKLKTNLVGGGTCLWVPEDEVQLTTKTITENGTYKASDDGYYGYSEVTVNGIGIATGIDGDGDVAVAHKDPTTGGLVIDKVPSSIAVVTPPTNPYGIYTDGQTITTDGMVVKAYLETGGEYETVPNNEITLDPNVAIYDPDTDPGGGEQATIDGSVLYNPNWITQPVAINGSIVERTENPIQTITYTPQGNGYFVLLQREYTIAFGYINLSGAGYREQCVNQTNPSRSYDVIRDVPISSTTRVSGTPFGIAWGGSWNTRSTGRTYEGSITYVSGAWNNLDFDRDLATIIIDGDHSTIQAGSRQQITVSWPRPGDGQVLETTFEILVAPGYTPGDNTEL